MGGQSPDHVRSVLESYLDTLKDCVDEDVEQACAQLMKANNPFVPSAGQVYTASERFAAKRIERANVVRLNAPREQYTEEHRESMKARFQALLDELKSGANYNPEYGKVPKGTKPTKPIVERTVPGSFLEKWEREHGRPHPARDRIITEANQTGLREAAE
jgi:hypothetical protein